MADKTITMEVVTAERQLLQAEVDGLVAPGAEGYLGVLPNHAPLVAALGVGVLTYRQGSELSRVAVSGGFMEVAQNRVVVLADTAEKAEAIDVSRAQRARERAAGRLKAREPGLDYLRAELALKRALARLKAAGYNR